VSEQGGHGRPLRRAVLGRADDRAFYGWLIGLSIALGVALFLVGSRGETALAPFGFGALAALFAGRTLLAPHRGGGAIALHVVSLRASAMAVARKRSLIDAAMFVEATLDDVLVRDVLASMAIPIDELRVALAGAPTTGGQGGTYRTTDDGAATPLVCDPEIQRLMNTAQRMADPVTAIVPVGVIAAATRSKTPIRALLAQNGITYRTWARAMEDHDIAADYPLYVEREVPTGAPIVIENDDVTTQAFVRDSMMELLRMTPTRANELMLRIHHEGRAEVGRYAEALAKRRAEELVTRARAHGFPLRVFVGDVPVEPRPTVDDG
jgi:ATP-dependent Clp protease adaptor protein ClpS